MLSIPIFEAHLVTSQILECILTGAISRCENRTRVVIQKPLTFMQKKL